MCSAFVWELILALLIKKKREENQGDKCATALMIIAAVGQTFIYSC